eukprot:3473755-Amphidinium_carterae.1
MKLIAVSSGQQDWRVSIVQAIVRCQARGGPGALGTAKYVHYRRLGDPLHTWPRLPEERWSDDEEAACTARDSNYLNKPLT